MERRRQTAIALNLGRNIKPGYRGRLWTPEELQALGTKPDIEVAARIGRTPSAVAAKPEKRFVGAGKSLYHGWTLIGRPRTITKAPPGPLAGGCDAASQRRRLCFDSAVYPLGVVRRTDFYADLSASED